jgi:lysyl-tRNA synthetase class II
MDFSEELLRQLAIDATGGTVVEYGGHQLDFRALRRLTMREAVWSIGTARGSTMDVRDPEWLRNGQGRRGSAGASVRSSRREEADPADDHL